jgi:hypothetical protein
LAGTPDQLSAGDLSAPSQVYCAGIGPFEANAVEVIVSAMAANSVIIEYLP